jgi:hypothetical protein
MWVVTAHECGGSTAEAIEVMYSFGGFKDEKGASAFAESLYAALERSGSGYEWFTQHFEVPEIQNIKFPAATQAQKAELIAEHGSVPAGHIAIDMDALVKDLEANDGPFMLPPAPKEDEVEAAIASIFGKCECDIDFLDPNCKNPNHINPPKGF